MSLLITLYVSDGIVMAGDSRTSIIQKQSGPNQTLPFMPPGQLDSNYNVFLTKQDVGIGTYGAGDIKGIPIGTYIDSFVHDIAEPNRYGAEQVANEIIKYFKTFQPISKINFHIAGYKKNNDVNEQDVWTVSLPTGQKQRLNQISQYGGSWGGESDILDRLFKPLYEIDSQGKSSELPNYKIPWSYISFQDAVDFAIFAIDTTVNTMRFQPRQKTVGGPVDVLTIKPDGSQWVRRKEMLVSQIGKEGYFKGRTRKVINLDQKS